MAGVHEMNGWGTGVNGLGSLRSIVGAHKNNRCVVCEIYGWGPGDQWLALRQMTGSYPRIPMVVGQEVNGCSPRVQRLGPKEVTVGGHCSKALAAVQGIYD